MRFSILLSLAAAIVVSAIPIPIAIEEPSPVSQTLMSFHSSEKTNKHAGSMYGMFR